MRNESCVRFFLENEIKFYCVAARAVSIEQSIRSQILEHRTAFRLMNSTFLKRFYKATLSILLSSPFYLLIPLD